MLENILEEVNLPEDVQTIINEQIEFGSVEFYLEDEETNKELTSWVMKSGLNYDHKYDLGVHLWFIHEE